jgi:hypothetical protein
VGVDVRRREMGLGDGLLQSWLKMSFRLGGDFAAETGVIGGDRNIPPPVVDGGVVDRKSDELDDDDGRLCGTFRGCDVVLSGIVSFGKIPNDDVITPFSSSIPAHNPTQESSDVVEDKLGDVM